MSRGVLEMGGVGWCGTNKSGVGRCGTVLTVWACLRRYKMLSGGMGWSEMHLD